MEKTRLYIAESERRLIAVVLVLTLASLLEACQNNESVMSDQAQLSQPAAAASTPAPATAQPPVAPPPDQPVGPVGSSPAVTSEESRRSPSIANIPVVTSPAKPTPTPTPYFKPRPTPTVKMVNGKIVQQWPAPAEAANLINPVKDQPNAAQLGRYYYLQKCNACHGDSGEGNGWLSEGLKRDGVKIYPTNLTSELVQANTDGELFWKITNGRSPMPSHRVFFTDEQRWYIVTFLRTLKK